MHQTNVRGLKVSARNIRELILSVEKKKKKNLVKSSFPSTSYSSPKVEKIHAMTYCLNSRSCSMRMTIWWGYLSMGYT